VVISFSILPIFSSQGASFKKVETENSPESVPNIFSLFLFSFPSQPDGIFNSMARETNYRLDCWIYKSDTEWNFQNNRRRYICSYIDAFD